MRAIAPSIREPLIQLRLRAAHHRGPRRREIAYMVRIHKICVCYSLGGLKHLGGQLH
jgi:hypothetical protein